MKICKHCQAENADELLFCIACGEALEAGEVAEEAEEIAEVCEETAEICEETAEVCQEPAKKKRPVLAVVLAVLVILAAAAAVYFAVNKDRAPEEAGETAQVEVLPGHHVNAYGYQSHSVRFIKAEDGTCTYEYLDENGQTVTLTQEEMDALLDAEVAKVGEKVLTNHDVMYYYDEQFYAMQNAYSGYLSMMVNTQQSMDEQISLDGANTWEQTILSGGLDVFHQMMAVYLGATEEGYAPAEDPQEAIATMEQEIAAEAEAYGFASADAYLQDYYGPAARMEGYLDYYLAAMVASGYLTELQQSAASTPEEQDAYYAANAEYLQANGLSNEEKPVVNVRHILIKPEETAAEDGTATVTDEAWAAAEAEANRIYALWQEDPTEDNFSKLAKEYSQDPGSQSAGGLYEGVFPGQMVSEFNDWCFADGRQAGDHTVVKTSHGYHVMYFSSVGETIYWRTVVDGMVREEKVNAKIAEMQEQYPMTADQSKVVMLTDLELTVPSAEEEAPAEDGGIEILPPDAVPEEAPAE